MDRHDLVADRVRAAHGDALLDVLTFRDELTLVVDKDHVRDVCRLLKEDADLGYNFLSDISADDLLPASPRFVVNYHLYSLPYQHRVRVQAPVEDPEEGPDTLADLWHVATWLEMEIWDLMGIRIKGNGALRRLFLPEDWQGHPLRKDYPLGYEEVQFSFNWQEIDERKPYARD